jgi:ABC-2 type transport system permease protein
MQSESMKRLAGAKLEGVDPALLEILGLSEFMDFSLITNYFGYVFQYMMLAVMMYAALAAVNSLIKEETDGTIEFLYSKPVSRDAVFLQKSLSNFLSFLAMLVVLSVVTVVGYVSFSECGIMESIKEVGIFYGSALYVGVVFMSLGILLSSLLRSSRGSSGIAAAIVLGTFILGIISVVNDDLGFLSYFSPLDWVRTQKLMTEGIRGEEWLIGISTILICFFASCRIYKKRDLRL